MPPMRSAKAREMILETRPETVYLPGGKFGETIPFTLTTGDCKGNRCQRGLRNCRRAVGSEAGDNGVAHFSTTNCEISASEHPYPGNRTSLRPLADLPRTATIFPMRAAAGPSIPGYAMPRAGMRFRFRRRRHA